VVHHERRDDQLKDTARQRIFEPRDRKEVDTFVGQAARARSTVSALRSIPVSVARG